MVIVKLAVDTVVTAVLETGPSGDEAGIRSNQTSDVVHLLVPGNLRIGEELIANFVAVLIKDLTLDVVSFATISGGIVIPSNDEPAAVKACHRRLIS